MNDRIILKFKIAGEEVSVENQINLLNALTNLINVENQTKYVNGSHIKDNAREIISNILICMK